jgi:anti-sigma B factor antagonist
MAITKSTSGDNCELFVSGRVDGTAANELEIEILAASRAGVREIFVNLSQAEWICSAGIRVLLQYFRQMKGNGKKLLVTRPSSEIASILEMTGFKNLIVEGSPPQV